MQRLFLWVQTHERHLSAAAVLGGFIFDNLFFNRIDEAITHQVFVSYLLVAAASITFSHFLEERSIEGARRPAWRSLLPIATQFALGGLWSGFLIFFSRSATLAASWPFLLLLAGIFVGNEIFRKYHDRLVFTVVLLFFALYSYTIFTAPILTREMGIGTFILSGVAAVVIFTLFLFILRKLGHFRFFKSIWKIRLYAGIVFVVMNVFYVANILPPLPLALSAGGIYHSVTRSSNDFVAQKEGQEWYVPLWSSPTYHVAQGGTLYAFSAVYAPIDLTTDIVHEWQWYSEEERRWETTFTASFSIVGGRAAGYRGYSREQSLRSGFWRVNIKTPDGRLIGRLKFDVVVGAPAATYPVKL